VFTEFRKLMEVIRIILLVTWLNRKAADSPFALVCVNIVYIHYVVSLCQCILMHVTLGRWHHFVSLFKSVILFTDLAQDGIPLLQVWYGVSQEMYGALPIADSLLTVSIKVS